MMTYELSLTPDYRSHWEPEDAIREILQNALDDMSTFEYSLEGGSITLKSCGVTLDKTTLLLGNTSKKDEDDSVGGFGEGYKIGLLILLREGYNVSIINGSKLWTPVLKYSKTYDTDVLCIEEIEGHSGHNDLIFIISNVSEDMIETVKHNCLYLQDLPEESIIETDMGRILKDEVGKLYVGGLFVNTTRLRYSYDFHPKHLQLNTDRKTVADWDLNMATSNMWNLAVEGGSVDPDFIAKELLDKCPDMNHLRYTTFSEEIKESCFELYKKTYGENTAIVTDHYDKESLEEQGYKGIKVSGSSAFVDVVKKSDSYNRQPFDKKEVEEVESPLQLIKDWFEAHEEELGCRLVDSFEEYVLDILEVKGVIWE